MDLTQLESSIDHMDEYISEPGGPQRLIEVLENIGGVKVGRNWSRKTMGFGMKTTISEEIQKDLVMRELPKHYARLLKQFAETLVLKRQTKKLEELMTGRGTSIIQHLLFVLKVRNAELCDDVVKKCIEHIFGNEDLTRSIVTNSVSAYLVETIILVATGTRLKKLWSKHLKGRLEPMWKDDIANFVVQRLIDAAQTEELFNEVTDEIYPILHEIFSLNRPGIGVCLAKACTKFPQAQEKFIDALMTAYYLTTPSKRTHLVSLMLFEDPIKANRGHKMQKEVWLHGSLMLQYIFRYKNTYDVAKSFLMLESKDVMIVATDKSGSHVVESFLTSETVPASSKDDLVDKLQGYYAQLQQDRFGCRIVEHLMREGSSSLKERIMAELCKPAPIGSLSGQRYHDNPRSIGPHRSISSNQHRTNHYYHPHHTSSGGMGMSYSQRRQPYNNNRHGVGMSGSAHNGWRHEGMKRYRDQEDYKERPTKRSYNDHSSSYRD